MKVYYTGSTEVKRKGIIYQTASHVYNINCPRCGSPKEIIDKYSKALGDFDFVDVSIDREGVTILSPLTCNKCNLRYSVLHDEVITYGS